MKLRLIGAVAQRGPGGLVVALRLGRVNGNKRVRQIGKPI
jgi:hypothetical protein